MVDQGRQPATIAADLKQRVRDEIGLTISVGVATSKSIAKIASDMDKPDGLTVVTPGDERRFLAPLPIRDLWGVGPKTAERLIADGVETIGDIARQDENWLRDRFGRHGIQMQRLALGQDDSPVEVRRETKSVSAETTFAQDINDPEALQEVVNRLSQRVSQQLKRRQLQGRTVKLKLRLSDFTTFTRQRTLPQSVQSAEDLSQSAGRTLTR